MKKYILYITLTGFLLTPLTVQAEKDEVTPQTIYMFGFAGSFTDSLAYQTQICTIDSAWINRYKFIENRSLYSLQLQYYMETTGHKNTICSVFFDKKLKKVQRRWAKVRKRYEKAPNLKYKEIPLADFSFKAEEYRPVTTIETTK